MPRPHAHRPAGTSALGVLLAAAALLTGCASAAAPPTVTPPPQGTPTPAVTAPASEPAAVTPAPTPAPAVSSTPSAEPSPSPSSEPAVIVTFRFQDGSEDRVELVRPADIRIARELLAGTHSPMIPNGKVVRGTGVNTGWSWHIDPYDFEWAEMAVEVCDGLPKYVENGSITSDRFCPWNAKVVSVEPVR